MKLFILIFLFILPIFAQVGKITYIKGDVLVLRDKQLKPAKVGMDLMKNDRISTREDSMTKLLLNDKSAISLGSKSELDIHDFLFDEKHKKAKIELQTNQGVFRIVTGKIAKISPDRFKLKTKTLTIGIRGTIFSGEIEDKVERVFCEKGHIYVSGNGITQELEKGYKTLAEDGKPPSKPQKYKASDLNNIQGQTTAWKGKACKVTLD